MIKKLVNVLLGVSIASLVLVGCGASNIENVVEESIEKVVEESVEESVQETIIVTDQLGREVEIPTEVERIVSSYYISSSLLIALGADDRVVGLEIMADTRQMYKRAAPHYLDLPGIGSGKGLNVEEVLALEPDLVILPYRLQEFIPQLELLDIPVIAVEPESMEDFLECILLIGQAIGEEERANDLANYYIEKIEEISLLTADIEDRPSVYMAGGSSPLTTSTSKMYQNDLIEMAGGRSVSEELEDGYWATISAEELLAWNPDYIYSVGYASYELNEFLKDPKFESLTAVQNGNVYTFPSILEPWDYPTPSSILGLSWLVNQLHPELYSVEQYTEEAQQFYEIFFGIEVDAEDMGL